MKHQHVDVGDDAMPSARGMEKIYEESEGKADAKPAYEVMRTNPDVKAALVPWLDPGCRSNVWWQKPGKMERNCRESVPYKDFLVEIEII